VDSIRGRTLIFCGDALGACEFSHAKSPDDGLPVVVVDEEIYRLLPSLVIATVDKFAQMPWKGEVQMLFGQVQRYCPRHGFLTADLEHPEQSHRAYRGLPAVAVQEHGPLRPPDLIIQDELHLITGPLGSLVGIYETAVDALCSWTLDGKTVRPKVIASTATIRRASDQVNRLFMRRLMVFPPSGISHRDSFFAQQVAPSDALPGMRYLGICAPGRRLKAALIRVYIACLCAGQLLYEKYGMAADPWMTLVGYFGSIRELGGMRRLYEDDIRTRARRMRQRGLGDRLLGNPDELTSRKTAADIPDILDHLEVKFDPEAEAVRLEQRKQGERVGKQPLDVVLATNMISVGVDVQRLGLMVVAGQPKLTAEYIQATSRVGRSHPGLVVTVHNWARPRDLSHYESFIHYHRTSHKQVETPTVTPFAAGARERALSATFTAILRLQGERYNPNEAAGEVRERDGAVLHAANALTERVSETVDRTSADEVRTELENRIDHWMSEARRVRQGGAQLVYQSREGHAASLLHKPGEDSWGKFTCLNSLREVEQTVDLILVGPWPSSQNDQGGGPA
jgi:hypothetical protein